MNNVITLKSTGQAVVRLQQFLNIKGYPMPITGYFGAITASNLQRYQKDNRLPVQSLIDAYMMSLIVEHDKIDDFCHAIQEHEGFFSPGENPSYPNGTRAWNNKNPGNLKYIEQPEAKGKDDKGFAIFSSYQDGWDALRNMIIRACTGQSKVYSPYMSILKFFETYAPAVDKNDPKIYADFVSSRVGLSVDAEIRNLL